MVPTDLPEAIENCDVLYVHSFPLRDVMPGCRIRRGNGCLLTNHPRVQHDTPRNTAESHTSMALSMIEPGKGRSGMEDSS